MRYFFALLTCVVLFIIFAFLVGAFGIRGIIPMVIFVALISITWKSIVKKDKKQIEDDNEK